MIIMDKLANFDLHFCILYLLLVDQCGTPVLYCDKKQYNTIKTNKTR